MKTVIAISVISMLALSMSILPTGVYAQSGAYGKGYKDATCDAVLCSGHGYDPRCPGDHSSEYCNNYRDGYAAGWDTQSQSRPHPHSRVNPNPEQPPGNLEPNQPNSPTEPSAEYYKGMDWWGICNNSLVHSYISQPCEILVSPDHRALTSQGKIVLEGILCPKGPSILSTIELFYGSIPDRAKNELSIACGWQMAR